MMPRLLALLMLMVSGTVWCGTPARTRVDLRCTSAGSGPTLDCVMLLRQGGQPLTGASVKLGAHMPSMPMAHSVASSQAVPGAAPGEYRARLELEMPGVWALEIDLLTPRRDRVVRRVRVESCPQPSCPAQVLR